MKVYLTPQCGEPRELGDAQTFKGALKIVEDLDKQWDDFWAQHSDFDKLPEDSLLRVYEGSDIELHDGDTIWWLSDNEWTRSVTCASSQLFGRPERHARASEALAAFIVADIA